MKKNTKTITFAHAAAELCVSDSTILRLVQRGILHTTKPELKKGHWSRRILVDNAFHTERARRMHGLKAPRRKKIVPNPNPNPNRKFNPANPSPIQTVTPQQGRLSGALWEKILEQLREELPLHGGLIGVTRFIGDDGRNVSIAIHPQDIDTRDALCDSVVHEFINRRVYELCGHEMNLNVVTEDGLPAPRPPIMPPTPPEQERQTPASEDTLEKCRNAMNICLEAQKACDRDMQECRSRAAECKGESAYVDDTANYVVKAKVECWRRERTCARCAAILAAVCILQILFGVFYMLCNHNII